MIPLDAIVILPVKRAYFCPDCKCLGNVAEQCPACGNRLNITLLTDLMNRPTASGVAGDNAP